MLRWGTERIRLCRAILGSKCGQPAAECRQKISEGIAMPRRNLVCFALLVSVLILGMSGASWAQVNTVNLSGTVLDPQGLAVKSAKVSIKNPNTGFERTSISNDNGRYELVGLPPGKYTLSVEAQGFATLTDTSFTLALGTTPEYNPQLQLKSVGETVSVSAAPELVDTAKTDVSTTVSQLQIDNLPINGRNYINFFSSRRRHTRSLRDWSSDVCSSDLLEMRIGINTGRMVIGNMGTERRFNY